MSTAGFPQVRLRRLRQTPWMRTLMQETWLHPRSLVWPVFVREASLPADIVSMPGVRRFTLEELPAAVIAAHEVGIQAVALFPCIERDLKTSDGREAKNPNNLICRALQVLRKEVPSIGLIADVALDPYMPHGHDGILKGDDVDNDLTLPVLADQAVALAQAGVHIVAPSDMMDGRIGVIRAALDVAGYSDVSILAYSAKFASAFYGPFRDAVGSVKCLGAASKQSYQMNPANVAEALREVALDLQEVADMVMVKPALPYLDVVRAVSETFQIPIFAYHVSGEYAMLKAAAQLGWLDYRATLLESLTSIKRAGAQNIITYSAYEAACWLKEDS